MTIDMYIFDKEEPIRSVLDYVHHLVHHISPSVQSSIKWKVPYYAVNQAILYLNPKVKEGYVEACFPRGRSFTNKHLLDFKDRKVVGGYRLYALEDINEEHLQILLNEAIEIDKAYPNHSPWKVLTNI